MSNDWMNHPDRPCIQRPADDYFPRTTAGRRSRRNAAFLEQLAAMLCDGCPVKTPCLDYAIEHHEQGVWGGTHEDQRAKMRRGAA